MQDSLKLRYTLCFCIQDDLILMLYRNREPNKNFWNGLGGKIEISETPEDAVKREIMEEANINLGDATTLHFAGIVGWTSEENKSEGMYVFIADFPSDYILDIKKETQEGILEWKPINWICDKKNKKVVSNISYFFPHMLFYNTPQYYYFQYENKSIIDYSVNHSSK